MKKYENLFRTFQNKSHGMWKYAKKNGQQLGNRSDGKRYSSTFEQYALSWDTAMRRTSSSANMRDGGMSTATVRRLMREQGMPVSIIAGAPMTTTEALEECVRCRCQKINMAELSAQLTKGALRGADDH